MDIRKNIDEQKLIGNECIALYVNGDNVIYVDDFGVKHIPKEVKKFIDNIYRLKANGSIMRTYFCIEIFVLF